MNMTHYMELLATNQPWNLILFMVVPIVLAETIAVTELYILYTRHYDGPVRMLNRMCSITVGIYFTGVFIYLFTTAVVPITAQQAWRGPADIIAVGFYLLGIVPLLGLALVDLNILGRGRSPHGKMAIHAGLVALFLVVGHIAMIFGMLDPAVLDARAVGGHSH
ncbi:MAG: permease [Afipia sp.]|jgi:hypothetical protein|nr:permease [Afipia sp.]